MVMESMDWMDYNQLQTLPVRGRQDGGANFLNGNLTYSRKYSLSYYVFTSDINSRQ